MPSPGNKNLNAMFTAYYVDNCSFVPDLIILIKTIEKDFKSKGIKQHGQSTSDKFMGSNS